MFSAYGSGGLVLVFQKDHDLRRGINLNGFISIDQDGLGNYLGVVFQYFEPIVIAVQLWIFTILINEFRVLGIYEFLNGFAQ